MVTSSHNVLVHNLTMEMPSLVSVDAGAVRQDRHGLFVFRPDDLSPTQDYGHMVKIESIAKSVKECQVVELELEDPADVIFVQVADKVFAGVFGSPGWPQMLAVQNESIDIQLAGMDGQSPAARSSMSDPGHSKVKHAPQVYRSIIRPHDDACTAMCAFHFSKHGCKRGVLCPWCHHPEHEEAARCAPTHRGKRRSKGPGNLADDQ